MKFRNLLVIIFATAATNIVAQININDGTNEELKNELNLQQQEEGSTPPNNRVLTPYVNNFNPNDKARRAGNGIIIVGSGANIRAFSAWGGGSTLGTSYAEIANKYYRTFNGKVNVYLMPIPTNGEYYTPNSAKQWSKSQAYTINNMFSHLDENVNAVDIYTELGKHVDENIYSRTDHHWLPLGAYYAAKQFAAVAQVPFKDLSNYDEKVVHRFCGTMYNYTKDSQIKNNPEDFYYYVPRDVDYTTTFIEYSLGRNRTSVTGASAPKEGPFFRKFNDGSSGAYCTFMGGDSKLVKVVTSTDNGRKVLILKDSFGNAIPGYLFYSFQEIHVVDCRYFTKNIVKYVNENNITDILFANNMSHACANVTIKAYERYLVQ